MAKKFQLQVVLLIGIGCMVLPIIALTLSDAAINLHREDATTIENRVRSRLPQGTPLQAVEIFLDKQSFQFHFEPPNRILYAVARKVKGSSFLVSKSLAFQFYFDGEYKLKAVEIKALYTGP